MVTCQKLFAQSGCAERLGADVVDETEVSGIFALCQSHPVCEAQQLAVVCRQIVGQLIQAVLH